jgi:signal transduction histidine kinase/ligand-binding sensor domain-containing protein/DNA-binding response OmpR family regulator
MREKATALIFLLLTFSISLRAEEKVLKFQHLTSKNGLPNNTIGCIIQDKYGFMWITTLDGLCRFDGYKLKVYLSNDTNPQSILNNHPIAFAKDAAENIWVSFSYNNEEVCRYNYETDDFTRFKKNKIDPALNVLLTRDTNKSIRRVENEECSWDINSLSLTQTNKKSNSQITYKSDVNSVWSLHDEFILSLYLDKQNVLWVGADNGGVSFADVHQPDFSFYAYHDNSENKIRESTIRAIYQAPTGELWVGTRNNGFARIDRNKNKNSYFKYNDNNRNSLADLSSRKIDLDHNGFLRIATNNSVRKIYGDRYGLLWIGTKDGLYKFDPRTNQSVHYTQNSKSPISSNWVYAINEDSEGNLWIGTWAGLSRYDRTNDLFIAYSPKKTLLSPHIRTIVEDRNHNFWLGTDGGGLTFLKKTKKGTDFEFIPTHFTNRPGHQNSVSDNRVYCLCEDNFGMIWVGTGRGLDRLNPATGVISHFPNNNFLADKVIHGILCENQNIWVSHQNGITQIDCKTLKTRDFTENIDLYNNEFSEDAYFRNPTTGECFFGGNRGICSFFPSQIQKNPFPPKVVLTDFRISNKSVVLNKAFNDRIILKRPIYLTDKIELMWAERNIQIEFAALHFSNPKNNEYAYRLRGFEKDWIITDARTRTAVYSNLPAGKYFFEVKASNCDGVWCNKPTVLEIIILPAWWKTWWAYLLYAVLILLLVFLIFKYILDRQKFNHDIQMERLKAEKIKELDEMKTKFFTNISHEFRTPLTLILDPVEKLLQEDSDDLKKTNYYRLIQRNAQRLLQLINQFLELKKVESGNAKLNPSNSDFVLYLSNLYNAFELHAAEHSINYRFETTLQKQMAYFDVDKMDKIILNLLSNAFKYTPDGGKITVILDLDSSLSKIIVKVIDTGIGIPKELHDRVFESFYQVNEKDLESSSGIGLALVKELVTLHNGTIFVENNNTAGSCFVLALPIVSEAAGSMAELTSSVVDNNLYVPVTAVEAEKDPESNSTELPLVLVVEDNADVRNYVVNELSDIFRISYAVDGVDGLAKALETIPDLVLSDIMMPGMNGLELCEKLKTDERTSHIPIVLLTAQQSEDYKISGYETGADAYITKPFSSSVLRVRISNLIESRHRLRMLFDKSTGFDTRVIAVNNVDKVFLDKLVTLINENIESPTFDVEALAALMHLSRTQLYRKIKSLTNKTAQEFVSTIRLNRAAELILSGLYSNTQVAEIVGYSEVGNFSRSFVRQFGMTPKVYKNSFAKE